MREIEFHGRRTDNKEWVYGYYFETPLSDEATGSKPEDGWYFLTGRKRHCISCNNVVYEVDPETVGQYIGRHDINGKEIYEGDTVKAKDSYTGREFTGNVEFRDCSFCIVDDCVSNYRWMDYEVEVIGNVWENPELLREG